MGFIAWLKSLWSAQKIDPNVALLMDFIKEQSDRQHTLMLAMLEQQKNQNETTKLLLSPYIPSGANTSTSLNTRLFEQEDNVEWDELMENPFKGI